jgi:hypothetical protein
MLIDSDGDTGEPLRHHYDMFLQAMRSVERREVETDPSDAPTTDVPQYHYILPSFFQLLKYLKENDYSFTLVFRTFGQDLPHVRCTLAPQSALA